MNLKEIEEFLKEMRVRKNSHLHGILTSIFSCGKGCTLRQKNNGGWYNHSEDVLGFLDAVGADFLIKEREEVTGNGIVHIGYMIKMDKKANEEFGFSWKAKIFLLSNLFRILDNKRTPFHLQGSEMGKLLSLMESYEVFKDFVMYSDAIDLIQRYSVKVGFPFTVELYDSYCREDKSNSHERWFYYMKYREVAT